MSIIIIRNTFDSILDTDVRKISFYHYLFAANINEKQVIGNTIQLQIGFNYLGIRTSY